MDGTAIVVTIWTIALTTPGGAIVEGPRQYHSQPECLAGAVSMERSHGGRAHCVASGSFTVPLPYAGPPPEDQPKER
jgi:hypothetical protein